MDIFLSNVMHKRWLFRQNQPQRAFLARFNRGMKNNASIEKPCSSQLFHNLFMTCSWLVYDLFMSCSWLVHNFFMTCSWLVNFFHNMSMSYSQLAHNPRLKLDYAWHTSAPACLNFYRLGLLERELIRERVKNNWLKRNWVFHLCPWPDCRL